MNKMSNIQQNQSKSKNSFIRKLRELDIFAGFMLTVCTGFMLFIYAPYELYLTNVHDFWFSAQDILRPTLSLFFLFLILGTAVFLAARLINKKLYYILLAGGLAAMVATYIQGTYLVSGLPPMDGTEYDWSQASPERIKTIITWVVAIAAVVFICWKFRSPALKTAASFVSVIMFCMLLTAMVFLVISNSDTIRNPDNEWLTCTNKNQYNMSSDENLVILILDAVDNTAFNEVLEDNPEFDSTFDGFTCYNNTLSGYIFTKESFPFMLSGMWNENQEEFAVYQNKALSTSPLITALTERDYQIGLYGEFNSLLEKDHFGGITENNLRAENSFVNRLYEIKTIIRMAGIRYAPWDMKSFMFNLYWTLNAGRRIESEYGIYSWDNYAFYQNILTDEPFEIIDGKNCRIIHLEGAHVPFQYDEDMNYVSAGESSYATKIEACLTLCDAYFNALKENGLYDNTAIVVMADHGYNEDETPLPTRTNPILLVKGINEHHDMLVSEAPISHEDCAQGFVGLLDGKSGNEIFEYSDGDARERRVMIYNHRTGYSLAEYTTTGRADDFDSLQPTGRVYNLGEDTNDQED